MGKLRFNRAEGPRFSSRCEPGWANRKKNARREERKWIARQQAGGWQGGAPRTADLKVEEVTSFFFPLLRYVISQKR
jgi:hypothetical protein